MGAIRRALFACAVAGLGAAAGCTMPDGPADEYAPGGVFNRRAPRLPSAGVPPTSPAVGKGPPEAPAWLVESSGAPLAINLATAMRLGNARPLDVQIAGRQVTVATAAYDRARLLSVPNTVLGVDYFGHAGEQQNLAGGLSVASRSTLTAGTGPNAVFAFSDAVYAPLAARQDPRARQAGTNDSVLAVAEAYFAVQQARGELAGALAAEARAEELVRRTAQLVKGLAPPAEEDRARAEFERRKQAVAAARERRRTAGVELARLLRLDPAVAVEPAEPPSLPVTVIDPAVGVDVLIPVALNERLERAGSQARDGIAAEVDTRFAEVRWAARRLNDAEPALKEAIKRVQRSVEGLGQTRRVGDAIALVVRPQDAVAALQAFAEANTDFFAAVADYNRAQFRLYGALGHPMRCLAGASAAAPHGSAPVPAPPPEKAAPAQPVPLPVVLQVKSEPTAREAVPVVTPAGGLPLGPLAPPLAPALPEPVWTPVAGSGPRVPTVAQEPTPAHLPTVIVEPAPAEPLRPPVVVPDPPR